MTSFDPKGDRYKWSGKDRRKRDDPDYRGPERRIERKRRIAVNQIITHLEKKLSE